MQFFSEENTTFQNKPIFEGNEKNWILIRAGDVSF